MLVLAELRAIMGDKPFDTFMDEFGRAHAGRAVSSAAFFEAAEKAHGKPLGDLKAAWLNGDALSKLSADARARKASGRFWSVDSFERQLDKTLIVYGTIAEADSQREAAQALQRKLAGRWANITLPIKADTDVTDSMIKDSHILLVGRPATNRLTARLAKALPVGFGTASFTLAGETYAHPQTAIVAAGPSPLAADRSVVIFAGLSAEATWMCPGGFPTAAAPMPRSCSWKTAASAPAIWPCRLPGDCARYRGRQPRLDGQASMTAASTRTGVARSRRNRHSSGTSISDGPSRSSGRATAACELVGPVHPAAGHSIRGRELEEVGVVELDVEVAALVGTFLDVLDRAIGRVVVDQGDHAQAVSDRRGELLRGHDEPAVSADRDHRPAAQSHGRADRRRKRPAQRDVIGRIEEPPRAVRRPVRLHAIAHLAGVGEHGDLARKHFAQRFDQPFRPGRDGPRVLLPTVCPSRRARARGGGPRPRR